MRWNNKFDETQWNNILVNKNKIFEHGFELNYRPRIKEVSLLIKFQMCSIVNAHININLASLIYDNIKNKNILRILFYSKSSRIAFLTLLIITFTLIKLSKI